MAASMMSTGNGAASSSSSVSGGRNLSVAGRLLIIAAKLYERELITWEEKSIFKRIIIQVGTHAHVLLY
jgi:hypothetical protein